MKNSSSKKKIIITSSIIATIILGGGVTGAVLASNTSSSNTTQNTSSVSTPEKKEAQIAALVTPTSTLATALRGTNVSAITSARDSLQSLIDKLPDGWTDQRIIAAKTELGKIDERTKAINDLKEVQITALVAPTEELTTALEGDDATAITTARDALQTLVNNLPDGWIDTRITTAKTELTKVDTRIQTLNEAAKEAQLVALATQTGKLTTALKNTNGATIITERDTLQSLVNNLPDGWIDPRITTAKTELGKVDTRLTEINNAATKETRLAELTNPTETLKGALATSNVDEISNARRLLKTLVDNLPEGWTDQRINAANTELGKVDARIKEINDAVTKEAQIVVLVAPTTSLTTALRGTDVSEITSARDALKTLVDNLPEGWTDQRITAANTELGKVDARIKEINDAAKEAQIVVIVAPTTSLTTALRGTDVSAITSARDALKTLVDNLPEGWTDQRITAANTELGKVDARIKEINDAAKEAQIVVLVAPTTSLTTALRGTDVSAITSARDALKTLIDNLPEGWTDQRITAANTELGKVDARIKEINDAAKEAQIVVLVAPTTSLTTALRGTDVSAITSARDALKTLVDNLPEGLTDQRITDANTEIGKVDERIKEINDAAKEAQIVVLVAPTTSLTTALRGTDVSAITSARDALKTLVDNLPEGLTDQRITDANTEIGKVDERIKEINDAAKESQLVALAAQTTKLTTTLLGTDQNAIYFAEYDLRNLVRELPEGWTDPRITAAKAELGKVDERTKEINDAAKEAQIAALVAPTTALTTALGGTDVSAITSARRSLKTLVDNLPEGLTDQRITDAKSKISLSSARLDELTTSAEKETQIAALVVPTTALQTALSGTKNKEERTKAKNTLQLLVDDLPEGWTDPRIDTARFYIRIAISLE